MVSNLVWYLDSYSSAFIAHIGKSSFASFSFFGPAPDSQFASTPHYSRCLLGITFSVQLEPRRLPVHRGILIEAVCGSSDGRGQKQIQPSFQLLDFRDIED